MMLTLLEFATAKPASLGRAGRALFFDELDVRSHVWDERHTIFSVPTAQVPNDRIRSGCLFVALRPAGLLAGKSLPAYLVRDDIYWRILRTCRAHRCKA
jgi:hypothetical protein